jgi:group I intron endonuclease
MKTNECGAGIYCIVNLSTGRQYVGQAVNLRNRQSRHICHLNQGIHKNSILQAAWNKYGERAFFWIVLERCQDKTQLTRLEHKWMSVFRGDGNRLYNICPAANSRLGSKLTPAQRLRISVAQTGRKGSEETKRKMSLAHKGNKYSQGHRQSPEHIAKKYTFPLGGLRPEHSKIQLAARRARMKKYLLIDPAGCEYTVVGLDAFCKANNLLVTGLTNVLAGRATHHHGWRIDVCQ